MFHDVINELGVSKGLPWSRNSHNLSSDRTTLSSIVGAETTLQILRAVSRIHDGSPKGYTCIVVIEIIGFYQLG